MQIQKILKKVMDYSGAIIGLILLSPLFLAAAILIKLDSKGSVFFLQERIGKNGKPFNMIKFRTLFDKTETPELKISIAEQDPRITRVGRFLRQWTIDEFPQFFNILRGEMSIVGPRPLPKYLLDEYGYLPGAKERESVLPGMASMAEPAGRNLVSFKKRFQMDKWYAEHWSIFLDLKIFFLALFIVLSRKGVYGESAEENAE